MTCYNVLYVPDSKSEWKKGATGQSFIRKEITSYRIGTLVFVEILSNVKKITKQQNLGNLTTNLSNNRGLVINIIIGTI